LRRCRENPRSTAKPRIMRWDACAWTAAASTRWTVVILQSIVQKFGGGPGVIQSLAWR
jgi:hypothetical protein